MSLDLTVADFAIPALMTAVPTLGLCAVCFIGYRYGHARIAKPDHSISLGMLAASLCIIGCGFFIYLTHYYYWDQYRKINLRDHYSNGGYIFSRDFDVDWALLANMTPMIAALSAVTVFSRVFIKGRSNHE